MSHPTDRQLLDRLPALSGHMDHLPDDVQLLVHAAAAHTDTLPRLWLESRLRAAACIDLQEWVSLSSSTVEELLFWVAGSRPLHYAQSAAMFRSRITPALREQLKAEIEAATPATPVQDRVGPERTHVMHKPKAIQQPLERTDERKIWLDRLQRSGHEREIPCVKRAQSSAVERLLRDAPHLAEPTRFVLGQLAAARRGAGLLDVPPLLLVGPPAAGKTWWAQQLGDALGVPSEILAMPGVTASFELSGGSASWRTGQPGRVLRAFLSTPLATPVLILDEIEKINAGNYDPAPTLLHLVERESARRWRDEFYDAEFDVSRAIIVATANSSARMDPALRSRFREIVVREPSKNERRPIIRSVWAAYRARRSDLRQLPRELSDEVLDALATRFADARSVQRAFDEAVGTASMRSGRLRLLPEDFLVSRMRLVPSVGSARVDGPRSPQ